MLCQILQESRIESRSRKGSLLSARQLRQSNALADPAALLPSASSMLGGNLPRRRVRDNLKSSEVV